LTVTAAVVCVEETRQTPSSTPASRTVIFTSSVIETNSYRLFVHTWMSLVFTFLPSVVPAVSFQLFPGRPVLGCLLIRLLWLQA
jgi:hypothetical protein